MRNAKNYSIVVKEQTNGITVTRQIGPVLHSRFQAKKHLARIKKTTPSAFAMVFVPC